MRFCSSCRLDLPDTAAYCATCGKKTKDVVAELEPSKKSSLGSGTVVAGLILAIVFVWLAGHIGRTVAESGTNQIAPRKAPSTDLVLSKAAATINSQLPMEDNGIRGERVVAGPGSKLTFYYTFVASPGARLKFFQGKELATFKKEACEMHKQMEHELKFAIAIDYRYSGNDGVPVGEIAIAPGECR